MPFEINSLADLNEAVATAAFCPEPSLSERRAIHESGAWRFVSPSSWFAGETSHWEPAPFATCPAASYALEQRMDAAGWNWEMEKLGDVWMEGLQMMQTVVDIHPSRLIAMCIASLRALGVEFTLREGWDAQ